jgi:hypothetical protein
VSNPGNAKWCEVHQRLECTKNRSKERGPCHQLAIRGLDACKNHSGLSIANAKAKGNATITAWQATGNATISPGDAVLGILQMSWLRLNAYADLLRRQVDEDGTVADDPTREDVPSASGLIGFRYGAAGKDGRVFVQSEEVRALVALEAAERDRVVRYSKVAHDMGISDRLVKLAERWGEMVSGRVTEMLLAPSLALSPAQMALIPELITRYLSSIDMDAPQAIMAGPATIEGETSAG